jgi:AcrR family transcriptional regulator
LFTEIEPMSRKYELKQRAAKQEQTRQRIVEAAVELHETLGPARTTLSAIAERAGVQRLTLYRHFPDDEAVFRACTAHWYAQHPPPDPSGWVSVAEPYDRLRLALTELYAFYRRGEPMLAIGWRDLPHVPALARVVAEIQAPYWEQVHHALATGWAVEDGRRAVVLAVVGHATAFPTWQSLVRMHVLDDTQAVELMLCLARCAAER